MYYLKYIKIAESLFPYRNMHGLSSMIKKYLKLELSSCIGVILLARIWDPPTAKNIFDDAPYWELPESDEENPEEEELKDVQNGKPEQEQTAA